MIVAGSMDGTSAKPIIVKDIILASGLAIDSANDRLYWSDAFGIVHAISSCDLDGTNRRLLIDGFSGAFAVAILQDRIFYSKTHLDAVVSIDKNTGDQEEPVASDKVYHMQFPYRK